MIELKIGDWVEVLAPDPRGRRSLAGKAFMIKRTGRVVAVQDPYVKVRLSIGKKGSQVWFGKISDVKKLKGRIAK